MEPAGGINNNSIKLVLFRVGQGVFIRDEEFFEASDKTKKLGKIIDPRHIERGVDFESLYSEFIEKEKGVTEYLVKLFQDLGGVLEKE